MEFVADIESQRFDRFVEQHELGTFQQCSAWGVLKTLHEGRAYRVGLEQGGELRAAALLLSFRFRAAQHHFLWAPRGFVVDFRDAPLLERFAREVRHLAEELGAVFVRVDPYLRHKERTLDGALREGGVDNAWLIERMASVGFEHTGFSTRYHRFHSRHYMWLDLERPLEAIQRAFHPKTRYNIRLAQKQGITIVKGQRDDLPRFSEIMDVTARRNGFKPKKLAYFYDMHDTLVPAGGMQLFLAAHRAHGPVQSEDPARRELEPAPGGRIVAGAIAVAGAGKVAYLYGASDDVLRNLMPNYLLQWEMMRWAWERGTKLYDFRGSGRPEPDSPLHGLYRFKKGFAPEYVELPGEFDMVLERDVYEVLMTKASEAGKQEKKRIKELRG